MDTRIALKKNERLIFPGMECVIDAPAGRGANVLAYIGHYTDQQHRHLTHTVLIRELFPYDSMGRIFRDEKGDIHVLPAAKEYYAWHRMTFLRGNEVHLRLAQQIPSKIDLNINTFFCRGTLYSLLGFTGGRSLEDEIGPLGLTGTEDHSDDSPDTVSERGGKSRGLATDTGSEHSGVNQGPDTGSERSGVNQGPDTAPERSGVTQGPDTGSEHSGINRGPSLSHKEMTSGLLRTIHVMKGALQVLQAFHKEGYLHLDLAPDNILLIGEPGGERVTLIDYNSVHTLEELRGTLDGDPGTDPKGPTFSGNRESSPEKSPERAYIDLSSKEGKGSPSANTLTAKGRGDKSGARKSPERAYIDLSIKEGYTAPEVRMSRFESIGEHSDLYSMTAVFWRCLSGQSLGGLSWIGAVLPDPGELPQWKELSEPVLSMMRKIIRRGLTSSPRRRYQNTGQMLADLEELEDRLTGRGITRWSLWESGRARHASLMRDNTGLQYIRDDSALYPISVERADGTHDDFRNILISGDRSPMLLLGGGGMGKTTALYRIAHEAYTKEKKFTENSTAVFYISLYHYRDGGGHFLRDTLLEGLRFKPQTDSMETARRELMQLLDQPPPGSAGPVLLLLLDGLNEASGDTGPLLHEIRLLAAKPGVQLLMTSRSDPGDPLFQKNILCRLDPATVKKILSQRGLLPPENMELMDLLCFPILLSMYIETMNSGDSSPQSLNSREQLLDEYFLALRKKETRNLRDPGVTEKGVDAVLQFLLPEISAQIHREGRSLSDKEVLQIVEKCYGELSKTALTAVHPEWIGHTKELRLGARTADEWYGLAVLKILWRRTALLVRDEKGLFRVQHQILEEYLAAKSLDFHRHFDQIKHQQKNRGVMAAILFALILVSAFGLYNYNMRLKITRKHNNMILAEAERNAIEYIRQSEDALESGNRGEAVRCATDAVLLQHADVTLAETALMALDGVDRLRKSLPSVRDRLLAEDIDKQADTSASLDENGNKTADKQESSKEETEKTFRYEKFDLSRLREEESSLGYEEEETSESEGAISFESADSSATEKGSSEYPGDDSSMPEKDSSEYPGDDSSMPEEGSSEYPGDDSSMPEEDTSDYPGDDSSAPEEDTSVYKEGNSPEDAEENDSGLEEDSDSEENSDSEEDSDSEENSNSEEDIPLESDESYADEYDETKGGVYAAAAQRALTDALGVYNLFDTFRNERILELPSLPTDLFLSPRGTRLCVRCTGKLLIFDTESGEEIVSLPIPGSARLQAAFTDEDTILYCGPERLCFYDFSGESVLWEGAPAAIVTVSGDRKYAAAAAPDRDRAQIYNISDGKTVKTLSFGGKHIKEDRRTGSADSQNNLFVMNKDGSLLAVSFEDGSVSLFDLETGENYELAGESDFTIFEGGFSKDIFAWSARSSRTSRTSRSSQIAEGSVCYAADTSSHRILDCFSSKNNCLLQADADNILVSELNDVYVWHPENAADHAHSSELITDESDSDRISLSSDTGGLDENDPAKAARNSDSGFPGQKDFAASVTEIPDISKDLYLESIAEASEPIISFYRYEDCLAVGAANGTYSFYTGLTAGSADEHKAPSIEIRQKNSSVDAAEEQSNAGSTENTAAAESNMEEYDAGSTENTAAAESNMEEYDAGSTENTASAESNIEDHDAESMKWHMDNSFELFNSCDFIDIAGSVAVCGSKDYAFSRILVRDSHEDSVCFRYDPSFTHSEARFSADRRTVSLYSTSVLRVFSTADGKLLGETEFPDKENIFGQHFFRQENKSWLEVFWYDGSVRSYSAENGELLSESKTEPPDDTMSAVFLTDKYRIVSPPLAPFITFNRQSGQLYSEFAASGTLTNVYQAGDYILTDYIQPSDNSRFGLLLDDIFDTLAWIPDICDFLDGEVIVDCPDGTLRSSHIYTLPELLDLAAPYLEYLY